MSYDFSNLLDVLNIYLIKVVKIEKENYQHVQNIEQLVIKKKIQDGFFLKINLYVPFEKIKKMKLLYSFLPPSRRNILVPIAASNFHTAWPSFKRVATAPVCFLHGRLPPFK